MIFLKIMYNGCKFEEGGLLMRRYVIYLMEQDVAKNYFGKEEMLYQLFFEAENIVSPYHSIIKKQIHYVTKELPLTDLHQTLLAELGHEVQSYEAKKSYEIHLEEYGSKAVLVLNRNYLSLYSYGATEAETVIFEILRKVESSFLALDFKNSNYGWLNPIKKAELV